MCPSSRSRTGPLRCLATGGDTYLGGDTSISIVEYAVAEFKKSDPHRPSRDPAAMGRLKRKLERQRDFCRAVGTAEPAPIAGQGLGPPLDITPPAV